jgi:hypothetical protein
MSNLSNAEPPTAEIIKLYEQELSRREIGKLLNMDRRTVGEVLKEAGKGLPPNAELYRDIPTAEIIKLSEQKLSRRKIGKRLGMGAGAVKNRLRTAGIAWRPQKLTPSQLEECRQDPAYEARPVGAYRIVPANRVVCRECGELKSELNANGNHSHLRGKKHHMPDAREYESKWPGARLTSFARSADQNRRQGRTKTIQDLMDEFAARYLTPEERKEYDRDQKYEEHHGITEFVACRLCGMKSKTDLHNHLKAQHDRSSADYRKQFPDALQLPLAMKRGYKREFAKERGRVQRRMADLASLSEPMRKLILHLRAHREHTAQQVRDAVGSTITDRHISRLRRVYGAAGRAGRRPQRGRL